VGLFDVDDEKGDLIAVPVEEVMKGAQLTPKRRSGVRPEYERDGPLTDESR
jgi:hypothetical protein